MLKGNSIVGVFFCLSCQAEDWRKAVPFTNWHEMECFEEATILAPVLNVKTLRKLWAKVNPQKMDDHLEAWSAHFFMQAPTRGSRFTGPQGTSWVGKLTLVSVSPVECRPCCEPARLLWAVSSLVVTNCPKASGGLSHPNAIFTAEQVPGFFSISQRNSNLTTRLYCELTEDS